MRVTVASLWSQGLSQPMERDFDKIQTLAMPERVLISYRSVSLAFPPYPNLEGPDSRAQTQDGGKADRSFRSWLGHKLTRSPTRFNSATPRLEYEAE